MLGRPCKFGTPSNACQPPKKSSELVPKLGSPLDHSGPGLTGSSAGANAWFSPHTRHQLPPKQLPVRQPESTKARRRGLAGSAFPAKRKPRLTNWDTRRARSPAPWRPSAPLTTQLRALRDHVTLVVGGPPRPQLIVGRALSCRSAAGCVLGPVCPPR